MVKKVLSAQIGIAKLRYKKFSYQIGQVFFVLNVKSDNKVTIKKLTLVILRYIHSKKICQILNQQLDVLDE